MLNYVRKNSPTKQMGAAMSKIAAILKEHDLMGVVLISDGEHGEFYTPYDPSWSACKMQRLGDGNINVKVLSKPTDYSTREQQLTALRKTVAGLTSLNSAGAVITMNCVETLKELMDSEMTGVKPEELVPKLFPDEKPETIDRAIELIESVIGPDEKAWAIRTPLEKAMASTHHGFGMEMRNTWGLWEEGPMRKYVQTRFNLFGHGDDISGLIMAGLWAKLRGEDVDHALSEEADRMRAHWESISKDPATGEDRLIIT